MKDIEDFEKKYKESDEEKEDIKKAYLGNLLKIALLMKMIDKIFNI